MIPISPAFSLIGHQGRCFDLRFSSEDTDPLLLSSSEDGTAKLWDTDKRKCLQTFVHNKSCEVLRSSFLPIRSDTSDNNSSFLCTAGSDGKVIIWKYSTDSSSNEKPCVLQQLSHKNEESQIYVCEYNPLQRNLLLTAADNQLRLWDLEASNSPSVVSYQHSFCWDFYCSDSVSDDHFGGIERNPDREAYVFDAKWHPSLPNIILSILSDNTMKKIDIRSKEVVNIKFPRFIYDEELQQEIKLGHPSSVCALLLNGFSSNLFYPSL
jgi:WD40 repeat protein